MLRRLYSQSAESRFEMRRNLADCVTNRRNRISSRHSAAGDNRSRLKHSASWKSISNFMYYFFIFFFPGVYFEETSAKCNCRRLFVGSVISKATRLNPVTRAPFVQHFRWRHPERRSSDFLTIKTGVILEMSFIVAGYSNFFFVWFSYPPDWNVQIQHIFVFPFNFIVILFCINASSNNFPNNQLGE